jgi:hypothetical protein
MSTTILRSQQCFSVLAYSSPWKRVTIWILFLTFWIIRTTYIGNRCQLSLYLMSTIRKTDSHYKMRLQFISIMSCKLITYHVILVCKFQQLEPNVWHFAPPFSLALLHFRYPAWPKSYVTNIRTLMMANARSVETLGINVLRRLTLTADTTRVSWKCMADTRHWFGGLRIYAPSH